MAKKAQRRSEPKKLASLYTYRGGQKIELKKLPDQFVVRQLPNALPPSMAAHEQVSGGSVRVRCDEKKLESLMTEARILAPAHHGYEQTESGESFLITDRIIVTFKQTPSVEELGEFLGKYALRVVERWEDNEFLLRLTNDTGMNPVKLVVQLHENETNVEVVDHDLNMVVGASQISLPTDPSYRNQWHLHRQLPAASDYDPRSSARCEEAWQLLGNFGQSDVVVGVTDDGCQLDHPDFNSANKFAGWGYFEGNTLFRRGDVGAMPAKMHQAGSNHGTSCAGVIAAEVDAEATVGVAAGCRLAPIKWESSGPRLFISDSKLTAALRYLDSRVDVISNSWGGRPTTRWAATTKSLIVRMSLTGGRRGKGVVFLWAAGNENCPVHHTSSQDVPFTSGVDPTGRFWIGVQTSKAFVNELVAIPGVLHIAALSSTAQRSHYSNYGAGIDLTAASSNSHAYRRLSLPGRGITTATGVSRVTSGFGGTSSATPLVAGVAALVISANPALTAAEVISLLKQTASKDLNMQDWPKTPPASYNLDTSWDVSPVAPFDSGAFQSVNLPDGTWSPWFGHGNVHAAAAVGRALNRSQSNVSVSSSVNLVLPDANPAGVASRIHIGDSGTIQDMQVSIDVTHTFIGDLVVALTSPSRRKIVLHNRKGGSTHNLAETYDEARAPGLAGLAGESIQGVWTLEVTDFARVDTGTFNSWRIDAKVAQPSSIEKESAPGLAIADHDPVGVSDTIRISDARSIGNIEVTVDITHTFIGDLIVQLETPSGTVITLHDQAGLGTDDLRRSYGLADTPDLRAVSGQPSAGAWTLKVADVVGQDVGKFNRWGLTIS